MHVGWHTDNTDGSIASNLSATLLKALSLTICVDEVMRWVLGHGTGNRWPLHWPHRFPPLRATA